MVVSSSYSVSTEGVIHYTLLSGLLHVTQVTMFLHGSGDYYNFLRKMNSPEHDSDHETRTDATDPPQVSTDVPAEFETASEIATAIINAVVDSVPVISGGIPVSGKNPAASLDVTPEVAEIIHAVYRGKGSIMEFQAPVMTTNRRNSTRIKPSTKPRAKYASEDDLNSVLGPLGSYDHGSWRKQKKQKVKDDPKD